MSEAIANNPFIPLKFGMEQRGMQMGEELPGPMVPLARAIWLRARDEALRFADQLHNLGETAISSVNRAGLGPYLTDEENDTLNAYVDNHFFGQASLKPLDFKVHKSLCNRITEPWMWITVVMTSTFWKNFFGLRCHEAAEIHFQEIARLLQNEMAQSTPVRRDEHLPYVLDSERSLPERFKISTARCARVSYMTHGDDKVDIGKDIALHDRLVVAQPKHISPTEHQGISYPNATLRSGPFVGWVQYRKTIEGECLD
jgi:hypothetical protein